MNEVNWMQQGWECPKCGAVMSPTTACCVNCRGNSGHTAGTIMTPTSHAVGAKPEQKYNIEDPEVPWDIFQANV